MEKEGNMSQLAGVQFLLSNEGKEVPLSSIEERTACICLFRLTGAGHAGASPRLYSRPARASR